MNNILNITFEVFSNIGDIFFKILPKFIIKLLSRLFRFGEGKISFGIRYLCYKRLSKSFGRKVIIFPNLYIFSPENIDVGTNVSIHEFSYIDATGGILIGDNVMIAHRCTIISSSHNFNWGSRPFKELGISSQPVIIGNNCWIGADVKIINGVKIGHNTVIGAGSVVTKNVPDNTVVTGIPAKVIRNIIENGKN